MTRTTYRVDGDRLVLVAGDENPIIVNTPEWFAWLEQSTAFVFTCSFGSFTARKENRSRGGWYWKAYYRVNGRLHRVYLGKTADLTLERLNNTATTLTTAAAFKSPPLWCCLPQLRLWIYQPTCAPPNSLSRLPALSWWFGHACSNA